MYYRAIMKRNDHFVSGVFRASSIIAYALCDKGFLSSNDCSFFKDYLFDEAFEWLKIPPAILFEKHKSCFCVFTEIGYARAKEIIDLANEMLLENPIGYHIEWLEYDNIENKYMSLYHDDNQMVIEMKNLNKIKKQKRMARKKKKRMQKMGVA